ncbi:MAG: helix-turn-helix domain-containing protein [Balneolaceae bacterium]
MKNISLLVVRNSLIGAVGNTRHMFEKVNDFIRESGQEAHFNVRLIGLTKEIVLDQGMFTIQADATLEEVKKSDLIIIPPLGGEMEQGVALNKDFTPWIVKQYKSGSEVASLCVGSFILANTGLLNGKKCSSHWKTANQFRKLYPAVHLVDDKIITDYNGLYTSGGSNSYWNLLIYLVGKYTSPEIAIRTSKYFEVELERDNQSPFRVFEGYKLHDDQVILNAQEYIEAEYQDKLTIAQISRTFGLERRTFQRRFKKATYFTVVEYIQNVRIEIAKKLLEANRFTVNEVMYEVGYNDPKWFRNVFKKVAGISPQAYKNRYQ